eukprot:TRINITY_DN458_c0_g1_i4.p1 TRINITY_DN458_c0_g1~~TRINITY_DN458_c0_g1_i4.p1  ORF type:complete len:794 (-),score=278.31 TRINITY_DN458_c0_g1_i4:2313-4694(-)
MQVSTSPSFKSSNAQRERHNSTPVLLSPTHGGKGAKPKSKSPSSARKLSFGGSDDNVKLNSNDEDKDDEGWLQRSNKRNPSKHGLSGKSSTAQQIVFMDDDSDLEDEVEVSGAEDLEQLLMDDGESHTKGTSGTGKKAVAAAKVQGKGKGNNANKNGLDTDLSRESSLTLSPSNSVSSNTDESVDLSVKVENGFKRMCLVCNVEITEDEIVSAHLQSKRHRNMVKKHQNQNRGYSGSQGMDLMSMDCIITLPVSMMTVEMPGEKEQKAYDERMRSQRKRAKKVRSKMEKMQRWDHDQGITIDSVDATHKQQLTSMVNSLIAHSEYLSDLFEVEVLLAGIERVLQLHDPTDLEYFRVVGGFNAIMLVFGNHDILPSEVVATMIEIMRHACIIRINREYLLMSNTLHILIDLANATVCLDEIFLPSLLHLIGQCIWDEDGDEERRTEYDDDYEDCRNQMIEDNKQYLVNLGMVDKIRIRFENSEGIDFFQQLGNLPSPVPGKVQQPLAHTLSIDIVRECLSLLRSMLKGDVERIRGIHQAQLKNQDDAMEAEQAMESPIVHALADNKLAGIPILMANMVLMSGPRRQRSDAAVSFDPMVATICFASTEILNLMGSLNGILFKDTLSADFYSELYHVVSHLIWYCGRTLQNDTSRELLHECILLLGYYCVLDGGNQEILQWGQSPTILQMLCRLPIEYFVDPTLRMILFPTLIAGCYRNTRNCSVLGQEMDASLLIKFVQEQSDTGGMTGSGVMDKLEGLDTNLQERFHFSNRFPAKERNWIRDNCGLTNCISDDK